MKDPGLAKQAAHNTLEKDTVKEEMCTRDMGLDSLHQKVTVERNHSKEISSLIDMVQEETGTML